MSGDEYAEAGAFDENGRTVEDANRDAVLRAFPRLDWHSMWDTEEPEEEWVHEPLLPARRSVAIYSKPKLGKSLLALEFAVAISQGRKFLGSQQRPRRVLYVDFENDPRGDVVTRLKAMGFTPDDLSGLDYLSFPPMHGFDTKEGAQDLLAAVDAYGSEVVIIDTISRAVEGKENENDTWLGLYRNTGVQLKRAGVSVLRLDHSGKDEGKGARGGSAKSGDVDVTWHMAQGPTKDRVDLVCDGSRLRLPTARVQIYRHEDPLHHSLEQRGSGTELDLQKDAIMQACADAGLALMAGRDTIRDLCTQMGLTASNILLAEIARERKALAVKLGQGAPS